MAHMDAQNTAEFAAIMLGGELAKGAVPADSPLGRIVGEAAGRKWREIPADELRAIGLRAWS
jgi:hypothetical protein